MIEDNKYTMGKIDAFQQVLDNIGTAIETIEDLKNYCELRIYRAEQYLKDQDDDS